MQNEKTTNLTVRIKNTSPLILSTGESDSSYVDNQMAFNEYGFPYFSARRFKGLVVESVTEVKKMLDLSNFTAPIPSPERVFGTPFNQSVCKFSDIMIQNYSENKEYMEWLEQKSGEEINRERIIHAITSIRQQTAITENGVSKDNSLRTIRILNPGYIFEGQVEIDWTSAPENTEILLVLAIQNLHHAGLNRSRGFGEIECTVEQDMANKAFALLEQEVS